MVITYYHIMYRYFNHVLILDTKYCLPHMLSFHPSFQLPCKLQSHWMEWQNNQTIAHETNISIRILLFHIFVATSLVNSVYVRWFKLLSMSSFLKKASFQFPIPPAVPCMQLACYASAFWVALTRVKDHMHHPGDVIAGALIGTLLQVSN